MVTGGAEAGISSTAHCLISQDHTFQFRLKTRDSHSFDQLRAQFCEIPGGLSVRLPRKAKGNYYN